MNLSQNTNKIVKISALTPQGRNPDIFFIRIWEKKWLNKFILKLSNVYCAAF